MDPEPLLMPYQDKPFNGDTFVEQEFLRLRDRFKIKLAIETGTCMGATTLFLARNFESVFTIEINEQYQKIAFEKFRDKNNITSLIGDSAVFLPRVLHNEFDSLIIFLDAHWNEHCPLLLELQAIADSGLTPVIVIHDFKTDNPTRGYDCIGLQPFDLPWITPSLNKIYGENGFDYHYNKEATEINRGVIYIYPKKKWFFLL